MMKLLWFSISYIYVYYVIVKLRTMIRPNLTHLGFTDKSELLNRSLNPPPFNQADNSCIHVPPPPLKPILPIL